MAARKKPGDESPSVSPLNEDPEVDADAVRERITKLTSSKSVPDPLALQKIDVQSTGLISLDDALGIYGFPKGRFISIEGPPGSGKTALALHSQGQEMRDRPKSVHGVIDVEGTMNNNFAQMLGVDTDPRRFIILRPETAEEACLMAMSLMGYSLQSEKPGGKANLWRVDPNLKPVSSIIYDSWAGSPTDEVGLAQLARVGAQWIPKISTTAERMQTTLYWINQIREKPGVTFGDPRYSPGGMAIKHAQSILLWVSIVNQIKDPITKQRLAHDLKVEMKKSKVAAPSAPILLHLSYSSGFDRAVDAYSLLTNKGISFKEKVDGNVLTFKFQTEDGEEETVSGNGKEKFLDAIQSYPEAEEAFINRARAVAQKSHRR